MLPSEHTKKTSSAIAAIGRVSQSEMSFGNMLQSVIAAKQVSVIRSHRCFFFAKASRMVIGGIVLRSVLGRFIKADSAVRAVVDVGGAEKKPLVSDFVEHVETT